MIWVLLYGLGFIGTFVYMMWAEWVDDREGFCPSFWQALVMSLIWGVSLPIYGFMMRDWSIKIPAYLNFCKKMDAWRDKKGW